MNTNKAFRKRYICFILLVGTVLLSSCNQEKDTLDPEKLQEQCDTGFGYSCYKLASMHRKLDIVPNTLASSPDLSIGAKLAIEGCKKGDNYSCSLYYNFIGEGISISEASEQLKNSCSLNADGSFLSCSYLVEGSFISDKPTQDQLQKRAFDLSVKECEKGEAKNGQACYFASKVLVSKKMIDEKVDGVNLMFKACELSKNFKICKESAEYLIRLFVHNYG